MRNYELGTKGDLWGGRVSFDTSVYYMKWKDVQQTLRFHLAYSVGGSVYTNATVNGQSASGPGMDLSVTTQPVAGLTVGINGSWNQLEMDSTVFSGGVPLFNKGDRLNTSPETTAGASAAYSFPLGARALRGQLAASANYTSHQTFRTGPPTQLGRRGRPDG